MAGEWLKMECATPDKPEVFAITAAMGWEDPDLAVGKLFRVWRWFDQQTTDGNARGVTAALLDRIAGATGFAQAMIDVGWLIVTSAGVELPNFDKHNGATAKGRAQGAKRVANHRSNATCNADTVTDALPREEKKREEKKEPKSKASAQPAVALPDWMPIASWTGYIEMRKQKRKSPTGRAIELLIAELAKLKESGQDIAAVLDKSTVNGWTDVYAIKGDQQARASPAAQQLDLAATNARNNAEAKRLLGITDDDMRTIDA